MKQFLITLILIFSFGAIIAQGGERGKKVKAQYVAFITSELDLSPEESARFWPIYNEYLDKQKQTKRAYRKGSGSGDYQSSIEKDEKMLTLKKKYYARLEGVIPANKLSKLERSEKKFKKKVLDRVSKRKAKRDGRN